MTAYKRLTNELKIINRDFKPNYIINLKYDLNIIDSDNLKFINSINFLIDKKQYIVKIYYDKYYPYRCPKKLTINGINLFNIYSDIIKKNYLILSNNCLCCKSNMCENNWSINKNICNILYEVEKVIKYKSLYIKRILLDKIIKKYTNQNLDFIHYYLL